MLEKEREWIRISEKQPPQVQLIEIFHEEYFTTGIGMYSQGTWVFMDRWDYAVKPTHWRPMI